MKKIKILRIITRLNIGGPAIHVALLIKELDQKKFESRLLCGSISPNEGDMGYVADIYDIKPMYIKTLKRRINPILDIIAFYHIFKYMVRYRPDIVHTHTAKAGTLGRIAAILANIPVKIHTFHGHVFKGYFNKISTTFFIFIEKILAHYTDRIITVSQQQKNEITNIYKITTPERCSVVRLGFDLDKFLNSENKRNVFRKKFNFKEDDILVGMIGRLTPIKNHKMFIDAVEHMTKNTKKDIIHRIKFTIIGDGELKNDLINYAQNKGLEGKISFIGWIKNIDEVYADLDIITITSMNEGTPVSLIEAMACSKPVIATDVGGIRDAVGEAGILLKKQDYKAVSDGILQLANSLEKRQELGRRGREFVKYIYSKQRLVAELEELYENLVSEKITKKRN